MDLSKWSISTQGNLRHNESLLLSSQVRIVYLEDHAMIRNTVIDYCIRPFFSNIEIIEFSNGDEACEFIKNEISHNKKIDLLITDINHPGLKGHELAKVVRKYEWISEFCMHIPIVILSMIEKTRFPELITDKIIDGYLNKLTEPEDLVDCLEEILYSS